MLNVSLGVIQLDLDKFIVVSRKNNQLDYGLIGGKIDDGETSYEALVREVNEETGLIVKSAFILNEGYYNGEYTFCYYITDFEVPNNLSLKEHIELFNSTNNGEGLVQIKDSLVCPGSSFVDYNIMISEKVNGYLSDNSLYKAFHSNNLYDFMYNLFPYNWRGVIARIYETGVSFTDDPNEPWLIGVSNIFKTWKNGTTYIDSLIKSCLFIAHDCFHNLWGLPHISDFSDESKKLFQKAQMSGEVAVLVVTEFILAKQIKKRHKELEYNIDKRNASQMISYGNELYHLAPRVLAGRLDEMLRSNIVEYWVKDSKSAKNFFDDYIPMLNGDITNIDKNWEIMKRDEFIPNALPNARYSTKMTGAELTQWMIDDFMHIRNSDEMVDFELREFNKGRREVMVVPRDWVY